MMRKKKQRKKETCSGMEYQAIRTSLHIPFNARTFEAITELRREKQLFGSHFMLNQKRVDVKNLQFLRKPQLDLLSSLQC